MIGQAKLLMKINKLLEEGSLPRFIIIIGEKGTQSAEVAVCISNMMSADCITLPDVKVDTIRKMIDEAYEFTDTVIYNIADADNMSPQAKNALLKVCEEPPNNAYFIMTLQDKHNTLETIKSRATVFTMDVYSKDELFQYYDSQYDDTIYREPIVYMASNPGEVDLLHKINVPEFYAYVEEFLDRIQSATVAQAFSLVENVSVKEGDNKYDITMFLKTFQRICISKANELSDTKEVSKYCWSVIRAGQCIQDIVRIKGVNRVMLLDEFVFKLRKIWK